MSRPATHRPAAPSPALARTAPIAPREPDPHAPFEPTVGDEIAHEAHLADVADRERYWPVGWERAA